MGVGGDGGLELEDGEVGGEPGVGRPGVVRVRGDPPDSPLLAPGLSRVKAEVLLTSVATNNENRTNTNNE